MKITVKSYSSESSLVSSIIFFIFGAILFTNAEKVISIISIALGILVALIGIVQLVIYYLSTKKIEVQPKRSSLAFGIVFLILAFIFIFFSEIVEQFIRFIVGAWILFSGIIRLINVLSMSNKNNKFIPLLIVSLLLIAVGIYTIVFGDVILSTIGIIMMIYAAIEITGYIFYSKGTSNDIEPGTTTLIVPDEPIEKKDINKSKIKDVKDKKTKNKEDKEK